MKEHIRSFQRQGISKKDRKAELLEWFHATATGTYILYINVI